MLTLLCGILMPSELVERPLKHISRLRQKPVETNPWSYQTHLAPDTWDVMLPSVTSHKLTSSRFQHELRDVLGRYETAICVGEISGVDLEIVNIASSPRPIHQPGTIAHLRTLKALTGNCPDNFSIHSPWAVYMTEEGAGHSGGFVELPPVLANGDRILVLLLNYPKVQRTFSPVWHVLMYWHLKTSVFDSAQHIYSTVGFGLDDKSMTRILPGYRGHLSAFCWRHFESRGTLQEGIDALQALYASASPAVVHK